MNRRANLYLALFPLLAYSARMNQPACTSETQDGFSAVPQPLREQVWSRYRVPLSWALGGAFFARYMLAGCVPLDLLDATDPAMMIGVLLTVLGIALRSWASGTLHKNAVLTVIGPYQLVRHPLYVGSFLMMGGISILLADWVIGLAVTALMITSYRQTIAYEESKLAKRFGWQWIEYRTKVPMLLPRLSLSSFRTSRWQLSRWLQNREYHAMLTTTGAILVIQMIHFIR